mgnify:CR=1 FL=1
MTAAAIGSHVVGLCARIWWRRTTARVGAAGGLTLLLVAPIAGGAFYVWVWGQVAELMTGFAQPGPIGVLALPTLLLGFALVCVFIRTALLAFDFVSPDVRIVLHTAPVTRLARALIQVLPDFVFSSVVALTVGSVGLTSYAAVSGRIGVITVLGLAVAVSALVGALTAVTELALVHIVKDPLAGRSGAAVVILLLACGVPLTLIRELQLHGMEVQPLLRAGTFLLGSDAWTIALSGAVTLLSLGIWGFASSAVVPELLRSQHRRPALGAGKGNLVRVSMVTFLRDPANLIGAVGMFVISVLGVWLEQLGHLPVAVAVVAAIGLLVPSAACLYGYGGFASVRWRVVVSPARTSRSLLAWLTGHAVAGVGSAAILLAPAIALSWAQVSSLGIEMVARYLCAVAVSMGTSTIAGWVMPYERDDVLGLAASGTVALVLGALAWWAFSGLPLGALVWVAGAMLVASVGVVALGDELRRSA